MWRDIINAWPLTHHPPAQPTQQVRISQLFNKTKNNEGIRPTQRRAERSRTTTTLMMMMMVNQEACVVWRRVDHRTRNNGRTITAKTTNTSTPNNDSNETSKGICEEDSTDRPTAERAAEKVAKRKGKSEKKMKTYGGPPTG